MTRTSVGRLAPSPTGRLHLGHARSFLAAWWQARSTGGQILLRFEDLDAPRSHPSYVEDILRDLEWLGIDWDGQPSIQSRGVAQILAASDTLLRRGLAYPCTCTRGEILELQGAPQQGVTEVRYPGTCRGRYQTLEEAEARTGKRASLRFCASEGYVQIDDGLAGRVEFDVAADVGDFVIVRKDRTPSYQLAVVVDDAAQGVTEVVRGNDLLASTARQLHLQRALALPQPAWFHLPLVCDGAGRRLAKRADDLSLHELRDRNVDARRIVAWAAETCGLHPPPLVAAADVVSCFRIDRIPMKPVLVGDATLTYLQS